MSARGVSYFIVPARYDRAASIPSDRCFARQRAALLAYAPSIPASLRESTLRLAAGLIVYARQTAAHAPHDTVCLVTVSGDSSGAACGISAAEIRQGVPPSEGQGTLSSLVPDGVATVTLSFRATARAPARSVTTRVTGNVYAAADPDRSGVSPSGVTWRAGDGRVLKQISAPRSQTVATACRRVPVACLIAKTSVETGSSSSRTSETTTAPAKPKP
jgi:hypothetical protein